MVRKEREASKERGSNSHQSLLVRMGSRKGKAGGQQVTQTGERERGVGRSGSMCRTPCEKSVRGLEGTMWVSQSCFPISDMPFLLSRIYFWIHSLLTHTHTYACTHIE